MVSFVDTVVYRYTYHVYIYVQAGREVQIQTHKQMRTPAQPQTPAQKKAGRQADR
jgi:hypothetical protein